MRRHVYTTSPQNQKIECLWSQLMRQKNIRIIDEIKDAIELGEYDPHDAAQKELFLYLWVPLVQSILDQHVLEYNTFRRRMDKKSELPTGCSADECYSAPIFYGGQHGLIPVDSTIVDAIIAEEYPDREALFGIVNSEFSTAADAVLARWHVHRRDIKLENVWAVFKVLYRELYD